jgi:hypothetical protein
LFWKNGERLRIDLEAAIAQHRAFAVAPDNGVTHEPAYPYQEADNILKGHESPLFLRHRVVQHVTRGGHDGAASQDKRQQNSRPRRRVSGAEQQGPGQRIGEDLPPIAGWA